MALSGLITSRVEMSGFNCLGLGSMVGFGLRKVRSSSPRSEYVSNVLLMLGRN
jgi:hypothetical protein